MPRIVPCPGCGVDVDHGARIAHRCATERLVDECLAAMRDEVDRLEPELRQWLRSPEGRRETWSAVREVRRRP